MKKMFLVISVILGIAILASNKAGALPIGEYGENFCLNSITNELDPAFKRALSLFEQRMTEYENGDSSKFEPNLLKNYYNFKKCLSVKYSDTSLENAEALFLFDKKYSSRNNLQILVDPSYKKESDILTAIMLAHEITHAYQYVMAAKGVEIPDCFQLERDAFIIQFDFISRLNSGEREALYSSARNQLETGSYGKSFSNTVEYISTVENVCDYDTACVLDKTNDLIRKDPIYKEECGKN